MTNDEVVAFIARLSVYANARNRRVDREPRTITITDDEGIWLLDIIDHFNLTVGMKRGDDKPDPRAMGAPGNTERAMNMIARHDAD